MMNEAELTILSLLSEAPRYGQELQHLIEVRGLRDWVAIGISSVYYLLNKLEKQELISSTVTNERKHYALTPAGKGVLQTSIAELLRQPHAFGNGFELGLAHISVLKPAHAYQVLQHHLADLNERKEIIKLAWEQHQTEEAKPTDAHRALYTHSIAMITAQTAWMTEFCADWLMRYPSADQRASNEVDDLDGHKCATRLSQRPTPDAAKLIQKLKRPATLD